MSFRDLFQEASGSLVSEHFLAAGIVCKLETDSELMLAAARQSFVPMPNPPSTAEVSLRLWVDPAARSHPPWPLAHFRGLDHLVVAAFDSENTVLVDLRQRRAVGRFSPAMALDAGHLRKVVFPTLFGIFTFTIPVTPLHCACVERGGGALLLTGASGSGKSTLSLALARQGFGFLSDEWTYFSWREGRLLAWGLSTPVKLLLGALEDFPELAPIQPGSSLNGEIAYEVEPECAFGVRRSVCAEPDCLIVLERQRIPGFSLTSISSAEVAAQFEDQVAYLAEQRFLEGRDLAVKTVQGLGGISCWRLRYGGRPAPVARALVDFLESIDRIRKPRTPFQRAREQA